MVFLRRFVAGKEHPSEKAAHEVFVLIRRVLPEPVDQIEIGLVEVCGIFFWEIRASRRDAPLEAAAIGSRFAHEDLKQSRHRNLGVPDEDGLVALFEGEAHAVENFHSVDGLGEIFHAQKLVARLAFRLEADERILAG